MDDLERYGFQIIALDFDGTLFTQAPYPEMGDPIPEMIDKVKELEEAGHKWILWTCRGGQGLQDAVDACIAQGITPDAVNSDIEEVKATEFGQNKSQKPHCTVLVDDRAPGSIEAFLNTDFSNDGAVKGVRLDLIKILI